MGLDTVEILMTWEEAFDLSIPNEDAERMQTPQMAIDYICSRLGAVEGGSMCPTLRGFHQLRTGLCACSGVSRREVKLQMPLRRFYRGRARLEFWAAFVQETGFTRLKPPGLLCWNKSVADLLDDLMTTGIAHVRDPNQPWSRPMVRAAVRSSVRQYVARRFHDHEHFIRDLKLD